MDEVSTAIRNLVREEVAAALRDVTAEEKPEVMPLDPRRLYSVATVADLLEVSKVWVYERIKSGELAVVELGSTRPKQRVAAFELQRFITARTFGSAKAVSEPMR